MPTITHTILGYSPFTVEFINHSTGTTKVERYAVVLTKREIEAEYDYIDFPPNPVEVAMREHSVDDIPEGCWSNDDNL